MAALLMVMAAVFMCVPAEAKKKEKAPKIDETELVKVMNENLPVYLGNGMSWTVFDIDEDGDYVMAYTSTALPAASEIDDNTLRTFRDALYNSLGANKGLVALCKSSGRAVKLKVYNTADELCLYERFSLDKLK